MKRWVGLCFLVCFSLQMRGQDTLTVDSIPAKPKARLVSNFVLQLDNRTEPYYNVRGRMNGLRVGMEFYKRLRFGVAVYANNDFYRIEAPQGADSLFRTAKFRYNTLFTELVIFRNWNFEVSLNGAYGNGELRVNTYNNLGDVPEFLRLDTIRNIEVFDLGVTAYYKIFPWLGVGVGAGTRQLSNLPDGNLRNAFSDPYIDFKMKLFVGYAYRGIFKPESVKAEKAYYDYRKKKRISYLK